MVLLTVGEKACWGPLGDGLEHASLFLFQQLGSWGTYLLVPFHQWLRIASWGSLTL